MDMAAVIMGSCKRRFLVRQPWIACPKDPRTEGAKIPPVRGSCADCQYFMCIVLPPAGDFLSVAFLYKERVSDGLLFPIAGKVGNRPAAVPHGRTSGFFNRPSSGSESRRKPIPCFGGAYDATLIHNKGSLETLGFKWRSLVTFCRYWQKVTRRRQKKRDGS